MFIPMRTVPAQVVADRQQAFLTLLPRLQTRARTAFAAVRCPHSRADAVADVVALGWEWFRLIPPSHRVAADTFAADAVATVQKALKRDVRERLV